MFEVDEYETKINVFISFKFNKIKQGDYFKIGYDATVGLFFPVISPELHEEMKIHYPEKLI